MAMTQRRPTRTRAASRRKPRGNGHTTSPPIIETEEDFDAIKPMPKTALRPEELAEYRELLLRKRVEIAGDVAMMTRGALGNSRQEACGDLSKMPIHMADVGTDRFEQEVTLGLIETESQLLAEIDHALSRIADGTYGVCEATHKPIGRQRLVAKPWARHSIAHARRLEQDRNHRR
jgi:DnaK suppressor protein